MEVWMNADLTSFLRVLALQVACYLNARIVQRAAVRCVVTASLQCQQMLMLSALCAMLHNGMMLTLLSKAGSHSMDAHWSPGQVTRKSPCTTANALIGKTQ